MMMLALCFLSLSFVSLWIRRDPKIWGSLLGISLVLGLVMGPVLWTGLFPIAVLALLWFAYAKRKRAILFVAIVALTFLFIFHLVPGYVPFFVTPLFRLGLEKPIIGLLPLALLVPLAHNTRDWKQVLQGLGWGVLGIVVLAIAATAIGATAWDFKSPSFPLLRFGTNLFLVAIPEEGFFRGFLQREISRYFDDNQTGKWVALVLTSILFTAAHVYWSPNATILVFVFLASLLYGGVYMVSGKIESAILTHFLLNTIHMTFFEYHAM